MTGKERCDGISEEVHGHGSNGLGIFQESQISCYNGGCGLSEELVKGGAGKDYKSPGL